MRSILLRAELSVVLIGEPKNLSRNPIRPVNSNESLGAVDGSGPARRRHHAVCRRLAGFQPARVNHFQRDRESFPFRTPQKQQAGTRLSGIGRGALLDFPLAASGPRALLVPAPP